MLNGCLNHLSQRFIHKGAIKLGGRAIIFKGMRYYEKYGGIHAEASTIYLYMAKSYGDRRACKWME